VVETVDSDHRDHSDLVKPVLKALHCVTHFSIREMASVHKSLTTARLHPAAAVALRVWNIAPASFPDHFDEDAGSLRPLKSTLKNM